MAYPNATFGMENLTLDPELALHGSLKIEILRGRNLPVTDFGPGATVDPFVEVFAFPHRLAKTTYRKNNQNPDWDETFMLDLIVDKKVTFLELRIYDKDYGPTQDDFVGCVYLPIADVATGRKIEGDFPVQKEGNKGPLGNATLTLTVQYWSLAMMPNLMTSAELPFNYFKMMTGNRVTLYGDAHVHPNQLAPIPMLNGVAYHAQNCWEDLYRAIDSATMFIYIVGWSVYTQISLLREKPVTADGQMLTVGELLKKKASQGVQVCIMVWDEALSLNVGNLKTEGLMCTHDEDTKKFFAGVPNVEVVLAPREGSDTHSQDSSKSTGLLGKAMKFAQKNVQKQFVGVNYTHHQKTVVVDQPALNDPYKRRVVAFVGGLDITDGRFDTPDHPIFSTLQTFHKGDFHQGIPKTNPDVGPRQPWHDIHSLIEGPAARNIMDNFYERWDCQANTKMNSLYPLPAAMLNGTVLTIDQEAMHGPEEWAVQVFRSIDGRSANFTRGDSEVLRVQCKKGRFVDMSIQRAYIHAIRRAKHHIYIENQYFLGSSQVWDPPVKGSTHMIPWEIVQKIRQKIFAGERFAVYIMVPLFPEGDPESAPIKEILRWQFLTVQMMYKRVADAIRQKGINAHPTDYLNFYSPGTREPNANPNLTGLSGVHLSMAQSKRQMIYVHSKMMIVDDQYVIIGTANINQRSMDGARDTEIAMGAQQVNHTVEAAHGQCPKGEVFGFRMSLWEEHIGPNVLTEPCFSNPSLLECVQRVNQIADHNWAMYAQPEPVAMPGHLMRYPYVVNADGSLIDPSTGPSFPDFPRSIIQGQAVAETGVVAGATAGQSRLLTM
eukprot:comp19500_c0_seq1/m.22765 comp19500_c0_seq1/g.22765  ORF comp19500_c0_seq1/g.22765 comp19500_c0_seq1/m.22765 type:complete len:830 (-) comp19500_c0_seq1:566-3055(-)